MSQQSNNIIASQVAAQEESVSSEYMQNIREIRTRVALGFYSNSSEDTGTVCVNRSGWVGEDGVIHPPIDDAFANKRNQLITYGLTSKKYAVLDGSSKLGDCMVADMSGDAFMGVWSNTLSNDDGVFRVAPVFSVEYVAARSLTEVMVKGFEPYNQFPVAYDIVLDVSSTEVDASQLVDATAGNDEVGVFYKTCVAQFIGNRAVFSVGQGAVPNSCDHVIRFAHPTSPDKLWNVKFHKMSLVVKKWNIGGRSAKIMYFSREKNFILYDRDISSITVFEEKSKAADKLEYGLTSNSCTVSLLDRGDRFTRNPDLLKRNRSINPAVDIVKQGEQPLDPSEREYQSLGRFY